MRNKRRDRIQEALASFGAGNVVKARKLCDLILKKEPRSTDALDLLANIEMRQNNYTGVVEILEKIVRLQPGHPQYQFNLGFAYMSLGVPEKAIEYFRAAVHLKPDFGEALSRLCGTAGQLGLLEEAVKVGESAVRLIPDSLVAQMNLATAYDAFGQTGLALRHYEVAASLAPGNPVVKCKLGDALAGSADRQAAENCYREAIRLQPGYTQPYRQISRLHKYTSPEHQDFTVLKRLLQDHTILEQDRSHLHFALGKMYEDCGLYDESFQHLETANRIENKKHNFDPGALTAFASDAISFYTPGFLESRAGIGDPSELPVFIVGMPRSGSTLLEQIIACHLQGMGAGELYWFGQIEHRVRSVLAKADSYPVCVRKLGEKSAHSLAGDYLEYLSILSEGDEYARITDKLPGNFMHLGLISLLFPNARIIHCRRNPLDTCFSIYSILFPGSVDFSHDLHNIGIVYNQYRRLMRHWEAVIPDRILTVDYEDLVQNQENVSRRLIDFIGLPWDNACLNFSGNKNRVRTVSAFQVRQRMYTSAVGRWKHYEKYLGPLIDVLQQ